MINVYLVEIPLIYTENQINTYLEQIPISEKKRINRMQKKEDKLRSLSAYLLTRYIICRKLNVEKGLFSLYRNPYGRPCLIEDIENWKGDFNISHSGKWIALAISDCAKVGIDIEEVKNIDITDLANFVFLNGELRRFYRESIERQIELFYAAWAIKESFFKMIGIGLSLNIIPPSTIKMIDSTNISVCNLGNLVWSQKLYEFDKGYKLAVSSMDEEFSKKINYINFYDLLD
ncbi:MULTISPECIES: 4'-phosphopantetheinyl transferase superfamily protein [Bacillus]|uniref:4'-phosphopantetheinyl transferase family protein n=1 Tax=Bacillus TaxID=1386 RepID=UPI000D9ACD69|nr:MULTISPECIES: 4'-phosphopantetheinyl transferase superfamily protein [Bacillus]MDA1656357.1 4'-phosphopantetheinyl transferase superfamily protein [Bacillus cereus group sp. TH150LC]PYE91523.1 4'-phosphopantetheinyl transferase [Bacillus sp. 196mf]